MIYNVDFDIVALILMVLVFILMQMNFVQENVQSKQFRGLLVMIVTVTVLDLITAVTISYAKDVPWLLNIILNSLYSFFAAAMGLVYNMYIAQFAKGGPLSKKGQIFNVAALAVWGVLLLINPFNGIIFSFTPSGEYVHGVCYTGGVILPIYYIIYAGIFLILNWKQFNTKQRICIAMFIIMAAIGPIVQVVWMPGYLLSMFTPALAVVVMFFSLETPDYHALMQTMKELEETKEVALKAQAEAEQSNKVKSQFLANMSHELRTPINAIIGNSRFIIDETKESSTLEYAVYVEASGKTLITIVNDILDFTEIEAGKLTLQREPYSLLSVIRDLQMYAEYSARQKDLEIRLDMDENLPKTLIGDSTRLVQILFNLVSNALKYTEEGWVEIQFSWEGISDDKGNLKVCVKDSGIGMTKEQLEKISESFTQAERNNQGVGLGLTIVTRLLHLMDSGLEIESTFGEGSDFSFSVPQDVEDGTPVGEISFATERALLDDHGEDSFTAPDARILAVDDYGMNLDLIRGMLRNTEIDVDTASKGEDALELLEKNTYHLLMLDHMMPGMDGVELLQEIRKRGLCKDVPIIVITANAVAGSREQYLSEGFDDFISKPIIATRFMAMLRKYLPEHLIIEKGAMERPVVKDTEAGEKSFLEQLDFLDTETGLTYCAGEEDFYREMLVSYLENDKRQDLAKAFGEEDTENYRILVHALKSTSLTIGATKLSEQAKALETAAKENNWDYIQDNHEEALEAYNIIRERIDGVLNGKEILENTWVEDADKKEFHILMVDDDSMNLAIGERMLGGIFELTCAKSGAEAMELLQTLRPDLIMLDIHMPEMNGFEVMDWLNKQEELNEIPVVFLTADSDRDVEIQGLKKGAKEYIQKPFVADIMIERVTRLLEFEKLKKHLEQEVEKKTQESTQRRQQVERMSRQIVSALTKTVDAKDKYTNGHSERVAVFAREIARRLGKSEEEQENVYIAGQLHDIGKIGIPGDIINKPTRLTDEEYAVIKTHPSIGAEILEDITELPNIAIGAHYHHERYDGHGYPNGLVGEEIPEYARIIGVADAYDAMTSRRSYRDPQTMEYVLGEIEKGKGTQFDPQFAEIMIQIIKDNKVLL